MTAPLTVHFRSALDYANNSKTGHKDAVNVSSGAMEAVVRYVGQGV